MQYIREELDGKDDYRHAPHQYRSHAGDKPCKIDVHFTLANFFNDPLIMKNILFVASAALFLSACASPARYAWVKEGASDHQRTNDTSECTYQVRLNKTPVAEQKELHSLCMQGKGYRMKRIG